MAKRVLRNRYRAGVWLGPTNNSSGYTFTKKPSEGDLAWRLLDYITMCDYAGVRATKREFLLDALEKKLRPEQMRGYLSMFFCSAQEAGIIVRKRDGKEHYYIAGINAVHYLAGTLKIRRRRNRVVFGSNSPYTGMPTRNAMVKRGAVVLLVAKEHLNISHFVDDFEYVHKTGVGLGLEVGKFLKKLVHPVEFEGEDLCYAPNSWGQQTSPHSFYQFGFETNDRWGNKWEVMFVKSEDIRWDSILT